MLTSELDTSGEHVTDPDPAGTVAVIFNALNNLKPKNQ